MPLLPVESSAVRKAISTASAPVTPNFDGHGRLCRSSAVTAASARSPSVLVVLFDNRTTLGLVKLRVKSAVTRLSQVFNTRCSIAKGRARRASRPSSSPGRTTRSTSCSVREKQHVDDQLRVARDQLQDRLLRSRARRQDDESRARLRQGAAGHARQAHLARDGDRAHAVLRFPPGRSRHDSRLQDALPPVHGARPGVLQRQPQADSQGRGWHRVRRRLADRAHGSEQEAMQNLYDNMARVRVRSHARCRS